MGVPSYSSCVLIGCLVLFFNIYTFFTDKKKIYLSIYLVGVVMSGCHIFVLSIE